MRREYRAHRSAPAESLRTYRRDMTVHHYLTDLSWTGSTGAGYGDYSRDHRGGSPASSATLELSADAHRVEWGE